MIWENMVQVMSGLNQTDSVAANAQYLADSEGFIKINKQP
jgi:Cu(I)/Ag(I) efflux system membrane fusion protein